MVYILSPGTSGRLAIRRLGCTRAPLGDRATEEESFKQAYNRLATTLQPRMHYGITTVRPPFDRFNSLVSLAAARRREAPENHFLDG